MRAGALREAQRQGLTIYTDTHSPIMGQLSAGSSLSGTGGTTSRSVTQPGGGVPFAGASIGVAAPGPAGHAAATQTVAGDVRVQMNPVAALASAATVAAKTYLKEKLDAWLR